MPPSVALASPLEDASWEELTGQDREVSDIETLAAVRRILGISTRADQPQPMLPAVPITPRQLGIY